MQGTVSGLFELNYGFETGKNNLKDKPIWFLRHIIIGIDIQYRDGINLKLVLIFIAELPNSRRNRYGKFNLESFVFKIVLSHLNLSE